MATEEERQEERDRLDNDPFGAPPQEQLEEENPTESPASESERDTDAEKDDRERVSSSSEPPQTVGKSTEGLTVGGTENQPDKRPG